MATPSDNVTPMNKGTPVPSADGKAPAAGKKGESAPSGPQYGQFGSKDNPEVIAALADYLAADKADQAEIKAIHQRRKARREGVINRGLNRHAIAEAVRIDGMTEAQRAGYDLTYGIARKAFDLPIQSALFEDGPAAAVGQGEGAKH